MKKRIPISKRTVIICDCEGYEQTLFNSSLIPHLSSAYILIETHDFLDMEITRKLKDRFKETHVIDEIESIDDIAKAIQCTNPLLDQYTTSQKFRLLAEYRPSIMRWLWMRPKA